MTPALIVIAQINGSEELPVRRLRRYSCVFAHDRSDCGPAALATVAKFYGVFLDPCRIRVLAETDQQGTDLFRLCRAARDLGFDAVSGRVDPERLGELPCPWIAHLQDSSAGHYVVVFRIHHHRVVLGDPCLGTVTISESAFRTRWSQKALFLRPTITIVPHSKPETVRALLRIACWNGKSVVGVISVAVTLAALSLGISVCFKFLFDRILPRGSLGALTELGLGMTAIMISRGSLTYIRARVLARLSRTITLAEAGEYVRHLFAASLRLLDTYAVGDLFARMLDANRVTSAVSGPVLTLGLDLIFLSMCSAVMFRYSPQLSYIALGFLPVIILIALLSWKPMRRCERSSRARISALASAAIERLSNMKVIRAYAAEETSTHTVKQLHKEVEDLAFTRATLNSFASVLTTTTTGMASVATIWYGALLAMSHRLSIGELIFFYSMIGIYISSLEHIAPSVASIQDAIVSLERIRDLRKLEPHGAGCNRQLPSDFTGSVELQSVTFGYKADTEILKCVSCSVSAGQTVALVGETGSGKSSVAYLIAGLYSPIRGTVLLDGIPATTILGTSLGSQVAIVFQEPSLLAGTILENIFLGNATVDLGRAEEVCKVVCAHEFICELPRGYSHVVGQRGGFLSSGQRQKIALARALALRPRLLILDEATSNLDQKTEREVLKGIREYLPESTIVVITHRLANVRYASQIFVLQSGCLIEAGSHEELFARRGEYHRMISYRTEATAEAIRDNTRKDTVYIR